MFIIDLECASGHAFEGWYETSAEYESIRDADELSCPLCGSHDVVRVLSTGSIRTTKNEARRETPSMPLELQKQLAKVVQWVRNTHEDVGDQFVERAIAMHRGEEEHQPIRGQTDAEGEKRLADEGVPFAKIPVPDIERN